MKNKAVKKGKKKKILLIILSVCLGILLISGASMYFYLNGMLGKINYKPITSKTSSSSGTSGTGDTLVSSKDVYNILLVGSDTRTTSTSNSRSDSMILLSINNKTKKTIMTSFMRDIYIPIPGHGSNRLNAAYSLGGISLLEQTIQNNFNVKIDRYVSVDFYDFINIIDKLGGINISVKDDEVKVLNEYINEINKLKGLPDGNGFLKKGGDDLLLSGKQALAYSRIRYVGNADFERTERQRTVLTKVIAKLKKQNIVQLSSVLSMLLPDVTTDFTRNELMNVVMHALTYTGYSSEQYRVPIDGSYHGIYIDKMDVLSIDFDQNKQALKTKING